MAHVRRHLQFGNPFAFRGTTRNTSNLPSRREYGDCCCLASGGWLWWSLVEER